jgi:hypothetical protein
MQLILVDTVFWRKQVEKDKEKRLMKTQSAIGRLKEEKDGQQD